MGLLYIKEYMLYIVENALSNKLCPLTLWQGPPSVALVVLDRTHYGVQLALLPSL